MPPPALVCTSKTHLPLTSIFSCAIALLASRATMAARAAIATFRLCNLRTFTFSTSSTSSTSSTYLEVKLRPDLEQPSLQHVGRPQPLTGRGRREIVVQAERPVAVERVVE